MPIHTIPSSPDTFTTDVGDVLVGAFFVIPAGTWLYAFWSRTGVLNSGSEASVPVQVRSSGHSQAFPTVTVPGAFSQTVAASVAQLADINAAAGGILSVQYGNSTVSGSAANESVTALTLTLGGGTEVLTFERATVYEGAQIGVETTPGTAVPANKRLLGLQIEIDNMTDIKPYRPQGNKFNTVSQAGKEFTQGNLQGIICYNDMLYLASSWIQKATPSVPVNNSTWNVTGASGPWGFTFKGSVLAPATYGSAAAAQAAIGAMPSVGAGNVIVTGAAPTFKIKWTGALSTDVSAITAPTGTPAPTITLDTAGTLTNRWKFVMAPAGPDDIVTYTLEKGAAGVANMAQQAPFGFVGGLAHKFTKSEASLTGDFMAQTTVDPFSLMTASPADVACVPIDPKSVSVFMGPTLTTLARMKRVLELDFGNTNRAAGLMTLNDQDPSFSNRIELAPDLPFKFFQEHNAEGQATLAALRAGQSVICVVEAVGPLIEAGFPYRLKYTCNVELVKPDPADVDGVYGRNYSGVIAYSSALGTGLQLEIDSPLSSL